MVTSLTSSPGDRVLRERQDVGVELLQLLELDRADAEPERVRKITTPDAEFRLDRRVRRIDYAIPVEIVVGVLVLHLQARGTVGVELQSTRLKVELEALRVDYRDRDENRIVGPERRAVRLPVQSVVGDLEPKQLRPRVRRCASLIDKTHFPADPHLGVELALSGEQRLVR